MTRSEILSNVFTQLRDAGFVYNKGDFARHLNYDPSYLSSRFSGNREISDKTFARILHVFPQVNRAYLFTGRGAILGENSGPREHVQSRPTISRGDSVVDALMAEREALLRRLEKINQVIDILCPHDMKNVS